MPADLSVFAKEQDIRYFLITFADLTGAPRTKLVPASVIAGASRNGVAFAGSATFLDLAPTQPDIVAIPDTAAVAVLPWKPQVAWLPADCTLDGKPLPQCPRGLLGRILSGAANEGFSVKSGVEPEFFLLDPAGHALADPADTAPKPCYHPLALMRCHDVIDQVMTGMADLGWGPYQADHEDANGQFELNWSYADALVSADRLAFFKFMLKSVAEQHGMRATFMPKPFPDLTGSGMHVHLSLWDRDGSNNLFHDPDAEFGLGRIGRHFTAGILAHAPALTAITNPVVNSYKRIGASRTARGASWAPDKVNWGGNDRTLMIRVPGPGRIEIRLPDGAANPYLLHAALTAAGLDGVRRRLDPAPHDDPASDGAPAPPSVRLPRNLLDAIRAFEADTELTALLGREFCDAYARVKRAEWDSYAAHFSAWEWDNGLDA